MRPIFVAFVAVLAVAAGCTKRAEGQTVAVVNGEEITVAELNSELAHADLPASIDKGKARSQVLQNMIDRTLLAQEAQKQGIDKSPEFVARKRAMDEDLLIQMFAERKNGTAQLPTDAEVAQFEAGHPQMFAKREVWNLDQLKFEMPSSATVRSQIAQTKSLPELAKVLSSNNIAATPAKTTIDSSVVPESMYGKIEGLGSGEPFIVPVGTQAVASVIVSRTAQPLTGDDARTVAVRLLRKQQTMNSLQDQVKRLRSTAKIQYQAGYAPASK
jgi:EpsD family peptidyl-prolyl cis-trans isomerase